MFTKDEINELFVHNNIKLTKKEIELIYENTLGFPLAINILSTYLKEFKYSPEIRTRVKNEIIEYANHYIFNKVDKELMEFILKISLLKDINITSVNYILEIDNAKEMLEKAERTGGFFSSRYDDSYYFFNTIKSYLIKRAEKELKEDELKKIYIRCSNYYETIENNLLLASNYYIAAKEYEKAANLLNNMNACNLATLNFTVLEENISKIPLEIIKKNPNLCINLAHIYRVNCKEDKANYWYEEFNNIIEEKKNKNEDYKKLKQKQSYYNVCTENINDIKLLEYLKVLENTEDSIIKEITFTGGTPSILNGGKDLSNWARHPKVIYNLVNPVILKVFKERQCDSAVIAVSENLYLKNRLDICIKCITLALDLNKNIDNLFVIYSLLDKIENAGSEKTNNLYNFYKKIEKENAYYLRANYEARLIENDILNSNTLAIINWLDSNELDIVDNFNTLDRYRYFVKVRALISIKKYTEALIILERLFEYIEKNKRRIYKIEYYILLSITLYLIGKKDEAYKNMDSAIELAQINNYIRLFADEGLIVYKILSENKKNTSCTNQKFYNEILKESKKFGELYPKKYIKNIIELTNKEIEIIELIKQGLSNQEISKKLNITLATVKTHINHIYSKLDTKNRVQTLNKLRDEKIID
jgi:LuxR family maltose regulon positive regulatory protein